MNATIKMSLNELTPGFISDLRKIFKDDQKLLLTIEPAGDFGLNIKESREEYIQRINRVLKKLEAGKSISFSDDEFDEFVEKLGK